MLLSKQQIQDVDDLPSKIVNMPEWGGDVKIRTMSAKNRIDFEKINIANKSELETMIHLIMFSCIDDEGNLLFDDSDFEFLSGKSAKSILKLFQECIEMSTLSQKGLEDKAKNS